jgi:hypothetical protein
MVPEKVFLYKLFTEKHLHLSKESVIGLVCANISHIVGQVATLCLSDIVTLSAPAVNGTLAGLSEVTSVIRRLA